jgi:peptidyl-prolyl cis-trans isomerase D
VKPFADAAFALKPNEISQPVLSPFGYHLIQVEEKKPEQDRTLDQAKGEIAVTLIKKEKASTLAKTKADEALKALTAGKSLADQYPAPKDDSADGLSRFMAASAPQATETGEFGEGTDVPQVGQAPALSKAIFATKAATALDQVFSVNQGYVVAQVTGRTLPTDQAFQAEKDKLREQALEAKQLELRQSYVSSLRKSAKIVTNEEAVNQVADAS